MKCIAQVTDYQPLKIYHPITRVSDVEKHRKFRWSYTQHSVKMQHHNEK